MSDKKIEIAYLGPKGTFSYESLKAFLANENTPKELKEAELKEYNSFSSFSTYLIKRDENRNFYKHTKIFIPIENSIGGSIADNINTLFALNNVDEDIQIETEHIQPIRHSIANLTGNINDIETVASHEQPLRQCSEYIMFAIGKLNSNSPKAIKEMVTASTVMGAKIACSDKKIAAIASHQTLIDAGLKIIADDIQDNDNNATRFILIGRDKTKPTGYDKTSIAITLPSDKAGALYDVLGVLAKSEKPINMTKIESRPTKDEMGEYWFFIDIEGHRDDPHIGEALEQIKAKSKEYRFLGSYPRFHR